MLFRSLNSHRAIKYPAPNSEKDKIGYVYSKTIGSREHSYVKHCGKLIHQKEINVDLSHKSKNENFSTISSKFHSCGPSHHYNTNQVNRNFQTSLYKFKYRKRHSNRSISVIKDGDNKTIYCDKHSSDLVMNEKLTKPRNKLKSISQINRKQREYNKENSKRSYLNNYLIPKEKLNMNNKNLKATLTSKANLMDNTNTDIWGYITILCLRHGKRVIQANQVLNEALKLNLNNVEILKEIAVSYTEVGEIYKSLAIIKAALEKDQENGELWEALADGLLAANEDKNEIIDIYSKALELVSPEKKVEIAAKLRILIESYIILCVILIVILIEILLMSL